MSGTGTGRVPAARASRVDCRPHDEAQRPGRPEGHHDDGDGTAGMGACHVSRLFKTDFGVAPDSHVIRKRADRAQDPALHGPTAAR